MQAGSRRIVRRYAFTVATLALAVAISLALSMWADIASPLIALLVAVVLSVARGGLGQGIIATVLGSAISIAWVLVPRKPFESDDIFRLMVFVVGSVLACGMIPHWRTILTGKSPTDPATDLLRMAMATAGEAVAVLTSDGAVVSANSAFARVMGQADETFSTQTILDAVFPSDRPLVEEALRRSRETGGDELDARILWRDTAPADANLIFVRYTSPDGSRTGHYCFLRALSRRKREEAKVHDAQDRFHDAFRYSPIAMAIIAMDGQMLEVNLAMCVLTGYMEPQLKVRDFQSLAHPDDRKVDLDLIRRLREGKLEHYEVTKRLMGPKGESVTVLLNITAVRSARGKLLYHIAQMLDLAAVRTRVSAATAITAEPEGGHSDREPSQHPA